MLHVARKLFMGYGNSSMVFTDCGKIWELWIICHWIMRRLRVGEVMKMMNCKLIDDNDARRWLWRLVVEVEVVTRGDASGANHKALFVQACQARLDQASTVLCLAHSNITKQLAIHNRILPLVLSFVGLLFRMLSAGGCVSRKPLLSFRVYISAFWQPYFFHPKPPKDELLVQYNGLCSNYLRKQACVCMTTRLFLRTLSRFIGEAAAAAEVLCQS